jgi:hypothetical protein
VLPAAAIEPPAGVAVAQEVRQAPRRSPALQRLFQQLGWEWSRAGGLAGADLSLFFDERAEQRPQGRCYVYRMKHPFTGELAQCGERVVGQVAYAPGVLSWTAAGQRICALVAAETGTPCGNNGVEILRNTLRREAGALHYRVDVRRYVQARPELARARNVPVEYERRTYQLPLDGRRPALLRQERQLCAATCVPLQDAKNSYPPVGR